MEKPSKKITNEYENRLTICGWLRENGRLYYICECKCGNVKLIYKHSYDSGNTKSCGCLHKEIVANQGRYGKNNLQHGLTKTREHSVWQGMINRCTNVKLKNYKDYGGRGIKVCERWLTFINFYNDMGPRPSEKHSLDRKDNDGDYCPENCRWATVREQAVNKRTSRIVTYNGKTQSMIEWAEEYGISKSNMIYRLNQLEKGKYTPDECFCKPIYSPRMITYHGKTQTIDQWAKEFNFKPSSLRNRLNRVDKGKLTLDECFNEPMRSRNNKK